MSLSCTNLLDKVIFVLAVVTVSVVESEVVAGGLDGACALGRKERDSFSKSFRATCNRKPRVRRDGEKVDLPVIMQPHQQIAPRIKPRILHQEHTTRRQKKVMLMLQRVHERVGQPA